MIGIDDFVKSLIIYEEIPFRDKLVSMRDFYRYIASFILEKSKVGLKKSEYLEYYKFYCGIIYIVAGDVLFGQYFLSSIDNELKKNEVYLSIVLVFATKSFIKQELKNLNQIVNISDNWSSLIRNYLAAKKKKIKNIGKLLKLPHFKSSNEIMILTAYLRQTKSKSKVGKFIEKIELFFQGITVLPILYKIKGKARKNIQDLTRAIVLCNQIWTMFSNYTYRYMKAMMMVILR